MERLKLPTFEIRGDSKPKIVNEPNGSKTYIIRAIFPKIDSLKEMAQKKMEHLGQKRDMAKLGLKEKGLPADYKKDFYSYADMIPVLGSPESIPMPEKPRLTVGFIRHLKHLDNKVSPEDQQSFIPKAEKFIDGLNLTPETAVYVITSPAANYIASADGEVMRHSRTDDTAETVCEILNKKGVNFSLNRIGKDGLHNDSVISQLKRALDEFPVTSESYFSEMESKINSNIEGQKESRRLPYPNLPTKKSAVYASFANNLKELELKTGIGEVSSATVARTLKGFDAIEDHFLREDNIPDNIKRIVVIMVGHGQFGSDISEALQDVTDRKFPLIIAGNGGYFKMNIDLDPDSKAVREIIINDQDMNG